MILLRKRFPDSRNLAGDAVIDRQVDRWQGSRAALIGKTDSDARRSQVSYSMDPL